MDDNAPGLPPYSASDRVGDRLRVAREQAGLTLAEVASRTRIPQRHLQAIETGQYSELPSPTYANGFAKAYARVVGSDEVEVGRLVRGELAGARRREPIYQPVEATDPARVPSRGLTIAALGAAIAVLILAGLYFGTALFRGDGSPEPATVTAGTPTALPAPVATPSAAPPAEGQVVVTATDEVWVRLYDADDKTLHQGTLQAGQSFDVPAGAKDPMINVGRPDHLRFTINGSAVQGLDLGRDPIKGVHIDAAALAARVSPPSSPTPTASSTPVAIEAPRAEARPADRRAAPERRADRPRRPAPQSETERANLEAARAPAVTANSQ